MSPKATPVAHSQLRQQVADRLRVDILEGRLQQGDWLRQERLAHEYGVSQMPVREALEQLTAEGLVEHIPYRGARVVELDQDDVVDLYACRAFIEGMAARHAVDGMGDHEVAELGALQERMRELHGPESLARYRALNRRFHEITFTASRRSFLVRTLAQLWAVFPTMLWASFGPTAAASAPGREAADIAEHDAIVAAFAARDADAAERAIRHHIEESGRQLLEALESRR